MSQKFNLSYGQKRSLDDDYAQDYSSNNLNNRKKSYKKSGNIEDSSSSSDDSDNVSVPNFKETSYNVESDSTSNTNFSSMAQKMMSKMGYKEGKGLGRQLEGIVEPVSASDQRGRRGFGFVIAGFDASENAVWDKEKEHIEVEEAACWMQDLDPGDFDCPELETLRSWMVEGPKLRDISQETEFCDPETLKQVLGSKSMLDSLPEREKVRTRSRCNPFETLSKLFFQNRAALKMANMDKVFDYMFTNPVIENGESLLINNEPLFFADVCAAPGGFSEYVLWRRKEASHGFCDAKGFGFTLKSNDFKLHDFFAAPPEFFEPHYGVSGVEGDGDIYVESNVRNFCNFVKQSTNDLGVHFMMADGGFEIADFNIQEILSKRIYLCQFMVALGIVREGGHFVCKVFDLFTPFSVGLVYLMRLCFTRVCVHKPNTSRPANSERYIVCKWRVADVSSVFDYLMEVNSHLEQSKSDSCKVEVNELVPLEILQNDLPFYEYLTSSNNVLGQWQIIALQKIQAFARDPNLIEERQATLRSECLAYWNLPDKSRVQPERSEPRIKAQVMLPTKFIKNDFKGPLELTIDNVKTQIRSAFDFRFVFLSSRPDAVKERGFFLGMGGDKVFMWNGNGYPSWSSCERLRIELPAETLIYGEIVNEMRGELKAQRRMHAFHAFDALVLAGYKVADKHLVERHQLLQKFCTCINKSSRNNLYVIRCKPLHKLEQISSIICEPTVCLRTLKGCRFQQRVLQEAQTQGPQRYSAISGVMFIKTTRDPWMMAFSKREKRKYFYNVLTKQSVFEVSQDKIGSFCDSFESSSIWWWRDGVQVLPTDSLNCALLQGDSIKQHVQSLM